MKQYVIFFNQPTQVVGGKNRLTQLTVRRANGPVAAFRRVTGWKGKISTSRGYSRQTPARRIHAFLPTMHNEAIEAWAVRAKAAKIPPVAFVVPLGEW